MIEKGHFVLADISGYTAFLTQLELVHSREILDHLLKILVEKFSTPFVIVKLEGDAVFAYAPEHSFMQAQTVLEVVEQIYFAFRLARDNLHRTCQCQACTLASALDLKLIIHYGEYLLQHIGAFRDLQGAEVIVAHRLLKNSIGSATGINTYAYFTEAAAQATPFGELAAHMTAHAEHYEHIGEVRGFVHDLQAVWQRDRERRKAYIAPGDAWMTVDFELPVSPVVAWEYLNSPQCLCEWCSFDKVEMIDLKWGRLGVGSGRYCIHANGKAVTVDTILDYQPFEYTTMESIAPNQMVIRYTTELAPTDNGVRVSMRASVPSGKNRFQKILMRLLKPVINREMRQEISRAAKAIQAMIDHDRAVEVCTTGCR
jgi:Protein of unknown function (DUF2652)